MIAIGSDHAGSFLKGQIIAFFKEKGIDVIDCGPESGEPVDYPDYAEKTVKKVLSGECDKAIVICGTGLGMSIAANKFPGIRAALCTTIFQARLSRRHNNANVLALGARVTGTDLALAIAEEWMNTEFEGGRHGRRVGKIYAIEEKTCRGDKA
jgi:ribose 5-phosphate isomerase B